MKKKLELPDTLDITDIKVNRLSKKRDERILEENMEKFIKWICHKFGIGESKELIKNFQEETNTYLDPEKQLKHEEREKKWDLEP